MCVYIGIMCAEATDILHVGIMCTYSVTICVKKINAVAVGHRGSRQCNYQEGTLVKLTNAISMYTGAVPM